MSNNSSNTSIWPLIIAAAVIGVVVQMIAGGNQSSSTSTTSTPTNTGSVEYRYAKERFRQEGFSSSDADTAARAVLKFHEAQKAQGR
jgi:hypothetical protein